jgi:uncharacterized membrane protein
LSRKEVFFFEKKNQKTFALAHVGEVRVTPHGYGAAVASFLASLVEFLEALTVVLAVGATRGWRSALTGAAAAALALVGLLAALGPRAALPAAPLRLAVGVLTLMFGLRWLRRAILRQAGLIPLHDEAAAYARARTRLATVRATAWDEAGIAAAFQVVAMEGIEVVLIVAAIGAADGALIPAAWGAAAALLAVLAAGILLHRPITSIPENILKLGVGIMLCAFGSFWAGEALGAAWPGGDAALPLLGLLWAAAALLMIRAERA